MSATSHSVQAQSTSKQQQRSRRRFVQSQYSAAPNRSFDPLSKDEEMQLAQKIAVQYGWDGERTVQPFQMAGIRAQLEAVDCVLQAPTGSGKTVIAAGPHCSPRAQGMITLISVPLIQLAEDMVHSILPITTGHVY